MIGHSRKPFSSFYSSLLNGKNDKIFHDRYIIIDYKETSEEIYHCGSSSKDTGSRVTAINRVYDGYVYYKPIEATLKNSKYIFK